MQSQRPCSCKVVVSTVTVSLPPSCPPHPLPPLPACPACPASFSFRCHLGLGQCRPHGLLPAPSAPWLAPP
eukprot:8950862-Heterocapsa_arctica.AAC.1